MNDLQTLHAALAKDDPAQDVVDRSRHRLQNRINGGPASGKRARWLVVGTGLTVAAAAAAVAVSVVPGAPADSPPKQASTGTKQGSTTTKTVTGQDILLAAATAAEQTPDGTGTYWHVTVTEEGTGQSASGWESWTTATGETWIRSAKSHGQVTRIAADPNPFSLFGADLTLDALRDLPTEPAALQAWLTDAIKNGDGRSSAGPFRDNPDLLKRATFDSLLSLVSTVPAPPAVRAAAFRAIAAYPEVKNLGAVPGGQGLLLPGDERLVVDPATGRVNKTSTYVIDGGEYSIPEPGSASITAEWTDTLPS